MVKAMKIKKNKSFLDKHNRCGYFFCMHWIIGLAMFFVVPLISSVIYSLSEVYIGADGLTTTFVKLANYKEILFKDAYYLDNLKTSVINMLTSLPIIIALSLFLALVLNTEFKGRLFFRAVFFLPVIIAGSVTMTILQSKYVDASLFTVSSGAEYSYGGLIDFDSMLSQLNLPTAIQTLFSDYLANVFNLVWSCGVQTILFLAGLQSISAQLYEVGKIEGANRWEILWFLEIPMLRNVIMLVLLFTMVELLTAMSTPVMEQITSTMFSSQIYDKSSAMMWGYFIVAGAFMGIILLAYNKLCMKRWE